MYIRIRYCCFYFPTNPKLKPITGLAYWAFATVNIISVPVHVGHISRKFSFPHIKIAAGDKFHGVAKGAIETSGRGKRAMENVFGKLQFTAHIATIPIHCLSSTIVHPLHRNLHIFPLKRQLKWKIQ